MLALPKPRPRRRPSLTPMIDVVFLLLVFFMLAARFGTTGLIPLAPLGIAETPYTGPPRLVGFSQESVALNGVPLELDTLADALTPLMSSPDEVIVLRPRDGADVQRLVEIMDVLRSAGLTNLTVVE